MSTNVIEFPGRPPDRQPPDVQALIAKVDAVRGIVALAARSAIEASTEELAHAGAALYHAVDQLQQVREAIEASA